MYRFLVKPKWIAFHVLIAALVAGMIWAGFWQLRRLDERRAENAVIEANLGVAAVPLGELVEPGAAVGDDRLDGLRWRSVTATGTYLDDADISIFNRSQYGVAGSFLVTPLELDDGQVLLVARGFYPLDVAVADLPAPPAGTVTVTGRIQLSQERQRVAISDPADGVLAEARRIDVERLAEQLPGPAVPVYLELSASDPAVPAGFPDPIPPPSDLSDGPHLSYAVQWFIFSSCGVIGWILAVRRSARSRTRSAATAEQVDA